MLAIIIVLVEYKPSEKKIIHSLWTIYYLCTFDHLQRKMKVGLGSLTEEKYPFQTWSTSLIAETFIAILIFLRLCTLVCTP